MKKLTDKEKLIEILQEDLRDAKEDYDQALTVFNYAESDYVEIAIEHLHAAEINLNATCKRVKQMIADYDLGEFNFK